MFCFGVFFSMNLNQAVEYLESIMSDDDEAGFDPVIFVQPPDVAYDSGGDDADEREGGVVHNLHFDQLRQPCELRIGPRNEEDEEDEEEEEEEEPMDLEPTDSSSLLPSTSSSSRETQARPDAIQASPWKYVGPQIHFKDVLPHIGDKFKWIRQQKICSSKGIFPAANYADCAANAYELFERFFDEKIMQIIVDSSNRYAMFLDQTNLNLTVDELKVFIGIMLISGYNVVSDRDDYWTNKSDMHNDLISTAMSRNRFKQISRFIHFTEQTDVDPHDKMWKLRPLTNCLNQNFLRNFHPEQDLSYDESMIAYFGRHSCKQFIKGKPLRFGYKVWCLNTPSGYLVSFEIYQGKNPYINPALEKRYGKCVAPLLQMIHSSIQPSNHLRDLPFCFYFDNLFTGIPVLNYLRSLGYNATGTIRENRLPRNCPLPKKIEVKKEPRGHMEYAELKDYNIALVKWNDNNCVSVVSTLYGKDPISRASRFSRIERKRILVDRPVAVEQYNKCMGGTDRMDQNVSYYRIGKEQNYKDSLLFSNFVFVPL